MSEKALIMLENDLGVKLDIVKDPLSLTAYDLEGNVISGGGGDDLLTCNIKVINHTGMAAGLTYAPSIREGTINLHGGTPNLNDNDEVNVTSYCYYDSTPFIEVQGFKLATPPTDATLTASDAVNCSLDLEDPSYPVIYVTGSNASITITLS